MSQIGRGYPFAEPVRTTPSNNDIELTPQPQFVFDDENNPNPQFVNPTFPALNFPGVKGSGFPLNGQTIPPKYGKKRVTKLLVPMDVVMVDKLFTVKGTFLHVSGQVLTLGTFKIRLDSFDNDATSYNLGQAISGVPFSQIFITNAVAQPAGTIAEITVMTDTPDDRIELVE